MGSAFHMLVPKYDTVDSNSHCPYGNLYLLLKVTIEDIKIAQQSLWLLLGLQMHKK